MMMAMMMVEEEEEEERKIIVVMVMKNKLKVDKQRARGGVEGNREGLQTVSSRVGTAVKYDR
jgi:hypothetical protein